MTLPLALLAAAVAVVALAAALHAALDWSALRRSRPDEPPR